MKNSRFIEIVQLIVSILVCQGAGFIGSIFTTPSIPIWYAALKKPSFSPPNWIFGPVWVTLYLLMGISLFLVWRKGIGDKTVKIAIIVFVIQLILNALWSFMFFGLKSPVAGLVTILILWTVILLSIVSFMHISKLAGVLLLPYILWVSFASVLNYFLWKLNPR